MQNQPERPIPTLQSHEEAVLWFISRFDWEMVNQVLHDGRTYQDFEKWQFIDMLRAAFDELKAHGNTHLLIFGGRCKGFFCPNRQKAGYRFYGNVTRHYLDLIVELDENLFVTDLYECNFFETTIPPSFKEGSRVYIDKEQKPV